MNQDKTMCPQCGKWYFLYGHMVGDQSMCPPCNRSAETEARENR